MSHTYFASTGEFFLIASLIYLILTSLGIARSDGSSVEQTKLFGAGSGTRLPVYCIVAGALLVMIASSVGIFRFAGVEQVRELHDALSFYAKHIGMVIYAAGVALLLLGGNYAGFIAVSIVVGFLSAWFLPEFLADVVLFLLLAVSAVRTEFKNSIAIALIFLLAVPITALLPVSLDIQMAMFHLLLALHFTVIARVLKQKVTLGCSI